MAVRAQSPQLTVTLKNGSRYTYDLSDIRKLTFDAVITAAENPQVQNVIRSFALLQNYPNPFNPSTTIRYELPREGEVSVDIFNLTGQRVRTIASGRQPPGVHEVVWDGTDDRGRSVASGLYLYRVSAGTSALQRKMLFLK